MELYLLYINSMEAAYTPQSYLMKHCTRFFIDSLPSICPFALDLNKKIALMSLIIYAY